MKSPQTIAIIINLSFQDSQAIQPQNRFYHHMAKDQKSKLCPLTITSDSTVFICGELIEVCKREEAVSKYGEN
jgi:hypothetical protein